MEGIVQFSARHPLQIFALLGAWRQGKAALKDLIASRVAINPECLPYNAAVLERIKAARADGREVVLASGSHQIWVDAVAGHLGLFDAVLGSDRTTNLSGEAKARALSDRWGPREFDYIGNDAKDFQVWEVSRQSLISRATRSVQSRFQRRYPDGEVVAPPPPLWRPALKSLRAHQWAKNALVFVPMIAAHAVRTSTVVASLLAFVAFSLVASSVYIVNDVFDIEADRKHPRKRTRPFAAGDLPVPLGLAMSGVLLTAGLGLALAIAPLFLLCLGLYYLTTVAYTFFLKRKMALDVVTLSCLYCLRVLGGGAATGIAPSNWLLAFSVWLFLALALIKRYTETADALDRGQQNIPNRAYAAGDLSVVGALAAAAGFNAATVLILYVSSDAMKALYPQPYLLWLILPVMVYWLARLLLIAHRRRLHDDPVVFALKDRTSLLCGALCAAIGLAASIHLPN